MPRRIIVPYTLVAVVAAGAVAASPAAAKPTEGPIDWAERFELQGPPPPKQDRQGGYTRDLLWRPGVPGLPTWPVDPQPLPRPAASIPARDDDDGDGGWLLAGLGVAGAGIAAGGAAGLVRRYRIRARLAV